MQRPEVSCAVRLIYTSLGAKGLIKNIPSAGSRVVLVRTDRQTDMTEIIVAFFLQILSTRPKTIV